MPLHRDSTLENIHRHHRWEVNNQAGLDALVPDALDIHKVAYKKDDDTYHVLKSVSPTVWVQTAYTKAKVDELLELKQDTLVSGTNIKTINGESVLGSGDIEITGGGAVDLSDYYKKTETYSKVEVDTKIADIPTTDLSGYYNKTETYSKVETNSLVATKQDVLVSGTSIKTINGQSVLGSGDIEITDEGSVQLTGNQTIAGVKTFSSSIVGDITGNSATTTKLKTPRTINGVAFDGSANITVSDDTKLTKTNPSIIGSITEQVYNLTGAEINPANGTIQYKTISANTTFTETLISGQSVLLRLINANKYTITFPTITWVGAVTPVPVLTANCAIALWKEQSTLYGAYIGTLV